MSPEIPHVGEVDPTHVGPPDLILEEIVPLSEVPEDIRSRFEVKPETGEDVAATVLPLAEGGFRIPVPPHAAGAHWASVTFAARALALIEGTDQPDYDDYDDPFVWVFALSAEAPVTGEKIVSAGGFAGSSTQTEYQKGEAPRRGKRASLFSAIRTEPRNA